MSSLSPTAEQVSALMELFRAGDGESLFNADFERDLGVCVRVTLQTGLVLQSVGATPTARLKELNYLRDDLSSALDFFLSVQDTACLVDGVDSPSWHWRESFAWAAFQSDYQRDLVMVTASETLLPERYNALLRLVRLQLVFWAQTFGMATQMPPRKDVLS